MISGLAGGGMQHIYSPLVAMHNWPEMLKLKELPTSKYCRVFLTPVSIRVEHSVGGYLTLDERSELGKKLDDEFARALDAGDRSSAKAIYAKIQKCALSDLVKPGVLEKPQTEI